MGDSSPTPIHMALRVPPSVKQHQRLSMPVSLNAYSVSMVNLRDSEQSDSATSLKESAKSDNEVVDESEEEEEEEEESSAEDDVQDEEEEEEDDLGQCEKYRETIKSLIKEITTLKNISNEEKERDIQRINHLEQQLRHEKSVTDQLRTQLVTTLLQLKDELSTIDQANISLSSQLEEERKAHALTIEALQDLKNRTSDDGSKTYNGVHELRIRVTVQQGGVKEVSLLTDTQADIERQSLQDKQDLMLKKYLETKQAHTLAETKALDANQQLQHLIERTKQLVEVHDELKAQLQAEKSKTEVFEMRNFELQETLNSQEEQIRKSYNSQVLCRQIKALQCKYLNDMAILPVQLPQQILSTISTSFDSGSVDTATFDMLFKHVKSMAEEICRKWLSRKKIHVTDEEDILGRVVKDPSLLKDFKQWLSRDSEENILLLYLDLDCISQQLLEASHSHTHKVATSKVTASAPSGTPTVSTTPPTQSLAATSSSLLAAAAAAAVAATIPPPSTLKRPRSTKRNSEPPRPPSAPVALRNSEDTRDRSSSNADSSPSSPLISHSPPTSSGIISPPLNTLGTATPTLCSSLHSTPFASPSTTPDIISSSTPRGSAQDTTSQNLTVNSTTISVTPPLDFLPTSSSAETKAQRVLKYVNSSIQIVKATERAKHDIVDNSLSLRTTFMKIPSPAACMVMVGKHLWIGCQGSSGAVKVIDHQTGTTVGEIPLASPVRALLYIGDSVWVAMNAGITVYNATKRHYGRPVCHNAHTGNIHDLAKVDKYVWSISADSTIKIWQPLADQQAKCVKTLKTENLLNCLLVCDGVVWVGTTTGILFYSGSGRTKLKTTTPPNTPTSNVTALTAVPPTGEVWSAHTDDHIYVWDKTTMTCKQNITSVRVVALRCVGCTVWTGHWDKTIQLWDARMKQCLKCVHTSHAGAIQCLEPTYASLLKRNHLTVWSGSADSSISAWNTQQFSHAMQEKPLTKVATCSICLKTVSGQGLVCTVCDTFCVHPKCASDISVFTLCPVANAPTAPRSRASSSSGV
ncbi:hypothetical protein Pelo_13233 [Pelomyxa schiedti]|nr:hypothetical protein Pelo_13233 [Pelomyxa schiedti]